MRKFLVSVAALAAFNLAGCAMGPVEAPHASLTNIQKLRAISTAPLNVGAFTAGPGAPTTMDKRITVRAGTQAAPGGSYARMLGDTLAAELKGGGKYDASAPLVVSGVVTDTHVDSAMPNARALLAARFTVKRDGTVVFDKVLQEEATWKSSFLGAVAIPDAINHYNELFPKLVGKLLEDPEFQAAARPTGA